MALLTAREQQVAEAIAQIGYTNPFLPKRIELEKQALGKSFVASRSFLQFRPDCSVHDMFPNATGLRKRCEQLLKKMREKLVAHEPASEHELAVYENLAMYALYARYMGMILELPAIRFRNRPEDDILDSYDAFTADHRWYFELPERRFPNSVDRDVIFAGLFQIERAFFHIFRHIVGASLSAARLRAAIWQSIFTHDMRRYLTALHRMMGDIPTLITGPSGTGKELVAQSIAFSQFVKFDAKQRRFVTDYQTCFTGLNLTAISPTLIESELFGHAKGAFTDAKTQRQGYLDPSNCPRGGSVFLDEIGDLDAQIQVKLLRVLQNREFQRVGEATTRQFVGKIIAATNRKLAKEMSEGRFREDFYYRLCADRIETPSLSVQLQESPEDIANYVRFIATRLLPDLPEEASNLTDEVVQWIHTHLGAHYPWPGNIRELEQCTRSIMVRGEYSPAVPQTSANAAPVTKFLQDVKQGDLSREELVANYCSLVYSKCGTYRATAKRLNVDPRTVKELVDPHLAQSFISKP